MTTLFPANDDFVSGVRSVDEIMSFHCASLAFAGLAVMVEVKDGIRSLLDKTRTGLSFASTLCIAIAELPLIRDRI